jgi:hypothetical protein
MQRAQVALESIIPLDLLAIGSQVPRRILRTFREHIAYNALPYNFSAPAKAWEEGME